MKMNVRDQISQISSRFIKRTKNDSEHRQARDNVITNIDSFAANEAYRAARTNIMFSLSGKKGCKTIVITGANQSEGKTTTAVNLAVTFAQLGEKVLVIDADLRRSNVHHCFGMTRKNGLSDVLCGLWELEQAIRKNIVPGLDVLPAGQIPPNPSELLASDNMKDVLAKLSQSYDYIFIDTPPVNVVTEAAIVARMCDGLILVVRQNFTTSDDIGRAVSALNFANCHILGCIVNDVDLSQRHLYYNKRYGADYQYTSTNKESKKIEQQVSK